MKCLGVDLFGRLLIGVHSSSLISYIFCQIWGLFSHYSFEYFFSLTLSYLSFWDSNDPNVRSFVIVPSVPEPLFAFFSICFLSVVQIR